MQKTLLSFVMMSILLGPLAVQNVSAQEDDLLIYVENIYSLLDEAKKEYAAGNIEEAKRLAMEAYIDNYEYLEDPVGAQDEELNEELEIMLRHELQNLIVKEAPSEEVHDKIDEILEKMDIVSAIVPEFGVLAVLVLVIGVTSVMVLGLKNNNSSLFSR